MKDFEAFQEKALPADHPAWNDDPEQKPGEGVTLVPASFITTLAMGNQEVDETLLLREHSKRPFVMWVRKGGTT